VRRPHAVATLVAFAALAASACADGDALARTARELTAIESGDPIAVPDHALTDEHGDPYNLREGTAGRFGLLFFGYTHCPDICPISVALMAETMRQLTEGERARVGSLFVSVDFERDDPERIGTWLASMRSDAVGLGGSRAELERVLEPMRVHVPSPVERRHMEGTDHDAYLLPHPSSTFLITPDGLMRFLYAYGRYTPEEVVADLRKLMALDW
jgi:protein SCO1/2